MPDNTMSFLNVYLYPKNHNGPVTNSRDNVDQKILQYDWCTSIPDQTYPNEEQQSLLFLDLSLYTKNKNDPKINSVDLADQRILQSD